MNHEHDENQGLIPVLSERITNGLFKENPTFVLLLGMCPTLAVTTSAVNGLGMGVTTMVVLALSNLMISALRKVIPDKIRIPAFIVIIASFVTIVELLLNAYIPFLYDALGLYIPLIVVNCIILGRAEAYAYSHPALPSLFDGFGMGMGFTLALTIIGSFREILGSGKIFDYQVMPSGYIPVSIFVMAPGAFFVLAMLTAIQNKIKEIGTKKGHDMSKIQSGCGGNCMECSKECKVSLNTEEVETEETKAEEIKTEESKAEEVNAKEAKAETGKNEDATSQESKADEAKAVEVKNEETKTEVIKTEVIKTEVNTVKVINVEEVKIEETRSEEVKTEDKKAEDEKSEDIKAEKVEAVKPKTRKPRTSKTEKKNAEGEKNTSNSAETSNADEDEMVLLDLSDYKKAIQKTTPSGRKPVRKKNSMAKAQAMLNKAEETLKEESDD